MRRFRSCFSTLILLAVIFAAFPSAADSSSRWEWLRDRILGSPDRANGPEAALARLGGSRLVLKADTDEFRAVILKELRDDVRRSLREARIPYSGLAVQGSRVEVRVRDVADLPRALTAIGGGSVPAGQDLGDGLITLAPTAADFNDKLRAALDNTIEIVKRRLNELGVDLAGVERDGGDRIRVLLPGVKEPTRFAGMMVARAQLAFRLIDQPSPAQAILGGGSANADVLYGLTDKEPYTVSRQVAMTGHELVDASPGFDQRTGEPIVSFRFSAHGARDFADITRANIGRPFAIVLDNAVIAAPVIREPILGGSGQISGGFTLEQANDLAILLRSGALPFGLSVVEQHTVEPAK